MKTGDGNNSERTCEIDLDRNRVLCWRAQQRLVNIKDAVNVKLGARGNAGRNRLETVTRAVEPPTLEGQVKGCGTIKWPQMQGQVQAPLEHL